MAFHNLNSVALKKSAMFVTGRQYNFSRWVNIVRCVYSHIESKSTCLFKFHQERQAKMEPFAGYMMPIVYKNQSIKSEHMQTRNYAAAFDVSHMMQTVISGRDRVKFIESLTVADVKGMRINKSTLSMFTNETGGIIDDCIISKRRDDLFIVSNAGNAEIVWSWLNKNLNSKYDVKLERLEGKGLVALQGPSAAPLLQTLVDVNLADLEFMSTVEAKLNSVGTCQVTRCGYTGEDGFEISVDPNQAEVLMELLCSKDGVKPAGLGARDTLRLEAGLCLHGHDINDQITPVEAALNWTIQKRRRTEAGFMGSEVILRQLKEGTKMKRVGLKAVGAGPPAREGCQVLDASDCNTVLGTITSGTFAPKLERNIAMAYLPTSLANKYDQLVLCGVRGKKFEYQITKMPFVKSNYYLKAKS